MRVEVMVLDSTHKKNTTASNYRDETANRVWLAANTRHNLERSTQTAHIYLHYIICNIYIQERSTTSHDRTTFLRYNIYSSSDLQPHHGRCITEKGVLKSDRSSQPTRHVTTLTLQAI